MLLNAAQARTLLPGPVSKRRRLMQERDLTSRDLVGKTSAEFLMDSEWAPCRHNCPVHADVREYIEHAARGQWLEAIDVIRAKLPYASICGRICHHPCETNCRRKDVDSAVAIREVKRFVSELQGAGGATVTKAASQDKAKVAIVGAGPAGLSAALDLAKLGYRPTVFEKFPVAGGIPATAIPVYRLPRDVIQQDVDWILAHGVELVTGVEIGKDRTLADLQGEGFEAVVIATGLAKSRMLPLPGVDNPRVFPVLEFLTEFAFDRPVDVGSDVLVIGGGNVAMDAARSAIRLGAKRVRASCLENEEEMPAWSWEQEEALEEGVEFIHRRGPVEITVAGGAITGVKARKVLRVFDDEKRFSPTYDDSDVIDIECDTVILAIGQMPDYGFIEGSDLASDDRGRMVFNGATQQTSVPSVFACGEITSPPGSAVEACASGQRAAAAVDAFLSGREIAIDDSFPPAIDVIPAATGEKVVKVARNAIPVELPEARRTVLTEVDHNYDPETAQREARRCMSCGSGAEVLVDKCAACLTCLRVCPFDIPVVTDVARISSALCQACGMCIAECPANAIVARGWDAKGLAAETAQSIAAGGPKIVAYLSGQHAPAGAWDGSQDAVDGVRKVYLTSVSRLAAVDLLEAFTGGADGVIVAACHEGTDRYPTATLRARKRVAQARQMLAEVGVNADRLQLVEAADATADELRDALAGAAKTISESLTT